MMTTVRKIENTLNAMPFGAGIGPRPGDLDGVTSDRALEILAEYLEELRGRLASHVVEYDVVTREVLQHRADRAALRRVFMVGGE
ncbi:hypothetical protein PBI_MALAGASYROSE_74 [Mycobacterium phage MalagasyRose]|uniref:Uncharacterized protein n=1 Tax=Mycobacterium phage MalagasyRose TaxID=2599870 RepID=A0A5J6TJA9_9CAUD|nr:hypothetical protein QEH39_gp14 [Mycobacterium phage MalagasyRose]QFG08922.1 hypothetical protein PBI_MALAGASYROSE_74 [Mycobacterium phage MalagasyRose]